MRTLATIFAGLLGLAFGSFLNVCLSRWPEGESVALPRSHCRHCARTLAWWENIPLLSWLLLRGRCRSCRAWIGLRYPLVEVLVAALWAFIVWRAFTPVDIPLPPFASTYYALSAIETMLFAWLLIALAILDAENFWLPNFLTLSGLGLGLLIAFAEYFWLDGAVSTHFSTHLGRADGLMHLALDVLLDVAIPALLILLVRWLYWLLRKREGMGLGDAKLMAMLGAWLGLAGALQALVLGALLCTLLALVLLALPRKPGQEPWALQKLPLGTFLCIGGLISGLWGQPILSAYLRWAGL